MLNIEEINNTIIELENSDTTFLNCEKLAWLYIVREHLNSSNMPANFSISSVNTDGVIQELDDILPQYKKYCEVKRQFQLGQIPEQSVLQEMNYVCTEIEEFINILYSSTDTPEERHIMEGIIQKLHKKYVESQ